MSDSPESKSATPSVVEIDSDDNIEYFSSASQIASSEDTIIEVLSDASDGGDNDEVEVVGESVSAPEANDVVITGSQRTTHPRVLHPNPTRLRRSQPLPTEFRRNTRRRRNFPTHVYSGQLAFPEENPLSFSNIVLQHGVLRRMFIDSQSEVSQSIMERINREDELDMDRKMEVQNIHNRKMLKQKQELTKSELAGYSNDISVDQNMLCELCGVELGEGIPQSFVPNPEYDESFLDHVSRCHVNAPWFCIRQCFDADRDLSKRVFLAKCGHVFCGRCIKNIGNRPAKRGKMKEQMSILNPQISAPRKCPANDCGIIFNKGKRTFTELFF